MSEDTMQAGGDGLCLGANRAARPGTGRLSTGEAGGVGTDLKLLLKELDDQLILVGRVLADDLDDQRLIEVLKPALPASAASVRCQQRVSAARQRAAGRAAKHGEQATRAGGWVGHRGQR